MYQFCAFSSGPYPEENDETGFRVFESKLGFYNGVVADVKTKQEARELVLKLKKTKEHLSGFFWVRFFNPSVFSVEKDGNEWEIAYRTKDALWCVLGTHGLQSVVPIEVGPKVNLSAA